LTAFFAILPKKNREGRQNTSQSPDKNGAKCYSQREVLHNTFVEKADFEKRKKEES
jgi:hypothetical protein